MMKRLPCLVFAAVALVLWMGPARAAWKHYKFPELGFAIDFPADTKTSKGQWKSGVARSVPTTVVSAELDDVTYQVIVADFSDRAGDTPSIMGEAAFILSQEGTLIADTMARTEPGPNAVYGRRVTVTLKDGGKKTSEVYATRGKLYLFVTTIAATGDLGNPIAARFQDSIVFDLSRDRSQ
jgi:hypothetical protein